jgi:hypothetical protein
MINSRSSPRVYLGYVFRENNPYFLVTQMPAKNTAPGASGDQNSLQIELFFTRAMAEDLVRLFDEQYLRSLLPANFQNRSGAAGIGADPYP